MGKGPYHPEDLKVMGLYSLTGAHSTCTDCTSTQYRDILGWALCCIRVLASETLRSVESTDDGGGGSSI